MRIAGLQKLTLLDFPGKTAATVFTPGCNLRCPFCHNSNLVLGNDIVNGSAKPADPACASDTIELDDFFAFLERRRGLLDGVCITGGEPLLYHDIDQFCKRIHELGFSVKLDTNGSFPDRLQTLVRARLIDFVALDVKNAPKRYAETVGVPDFDLSGIRATIDFLLTDAVPYEFRTTIVRELHEPDDVRHLAEWIQGARAWYLQSFIDAESVLVGQGRLHPWNPDNLRAILPELRTFVPNTDVRGI